MICRLFAVIRAGELSILVLRPGRVSWELWRRYLACLTAILAYGGDSSENENVQGHVSTSNSPSCASCIRSTAR